jgi:DNA-binding transcriptional regulator GbsR (MarR family)
MEISDRINELGFADDMGMLYEELGAPRVWGRVFGWLMICQPDLQSTEDLATALHATKGSISVVTQALVRAGAVERHILRGDRRTYYRIRPGAMVCVFDEQIRVFTKLCSLVKRGLSLIKSEPIECRRRLEELYDLLTFYEHEVVAMLARWRERNQGAVGFG